MADEWFTAVVSCVSAATITVNDVPSVVQGYYVNTALSAHQASFQDNGSTILKTASSSAEGVTGSFGGTGGGARFETNCIIICEASMTGNFTVFYKDMERR